MPIEKHPIKAFLCHASQDKPIARALSRRLMAEGWIDVWLDEEKLLPGQDWRLNIEQAVEASDVVIICLSNHSVSKEGFIQKELRYAREIALEKPEETIFLIPLRLDECDVPRGLRFYQWADYFGEKEEETYKSLLESLKLRHRQKLGIQGQERIPQKKGKPEHNSPIEKVKETEAMVETRRLEPSKYDVFLSYAAADKDEARELSAFLTKKKLNVFLSGKDIQPGSKWEDEIKDALKNSRLMCILATPNSLKSEWVTTEWAVAWANSVRILPVLLRCSVSELPDRLKAHQAIDFHEMRRIVELLKQPN